MRVGNALEMQVDDEIPFVCAIGFFPRKAQRCAATQNIEIDQNFLNQGFGGLPSKRNNLNGQGEGPKTRYLFCRVGNHDHLIRSGCYDFFLQQSTTTTFDEVQVWVKLIRAVNREIQPFHLVQGFDCDANFTGKLCCAG